MVVVYDVVCVVYIVVIIVAIVVSCIVMLWLIMIDFCRCLEYVRPAAQLLLLLSCLCLCCVHVVINVVIVVLCSCGDYMIHGDVVLIFSMIGRLPL